MLAIVVLCVLGVWIYSSQLAGWLSIYSPSQSPQCLCLGSATNYSADKAVVNSEASSAYYIDPLKTLTVSIP